MKTVVDYLQANKKYEHDFQGRAFELELTDKDIELGCNNEVYSIMLSQTGYEVEDIIQTILEEDHKIAIRFCEECGTPFDAGFMAGDGDWYSCEDCFNDAMDRTYGKGNWRSSEDEGENGGWYEYLDEDKWEDTGIFYTEWY